MPRFRDTFIRLQRRMRPRQHTEPSPALSAEEATPAQPTEAQDGRQTRGESFERTPDEVVRRLIEQSERRNSHIRNIEAEAARLWAEAVILESEIHASRRHARPGPAAASPWGNTVGSIVLHQILIDENVQQRRNQDRNANQNQPPASDELANENGARSSIQGHLPEEGRHEHEIEFESSSGLAHIGEHIMRVFNDLSAEERPAMAAWIVLMAAAQVRRDLESTGEQHELAGRHAD